MASASFSSSEGKFNRPPAIRRSFFFLQHTQSDSIVQAVVGGIPYDHILAQTEHKLTAINRNDKAADMTQRLLSAHSLV
jgi:hypothetical protein